MDFLLSMLATAADALFFTWMRRERREREGRPQRPMKDDIAEVAYFDLVTGVVWSAIAVALFVILAFAGLPFGWCLALSFVPVVFYLAWRFRRLMRE